MTLDSRGPSAAVENLVVREEGAGGTAAPASGNAADGLGFEGQSGRQSRSGRLPLAAVFSWALQTSVSSAISASRYRGIGK